MYKNINDLDLMKSEENTQCTGRWTTNGDSHKLYPFHTWYDNYEYECSNE